MTFLCQQGGSNSDVAMTSRKSLCTYKNLKCHELEGYGIILFVIKVDNLWDGIKIAGLVWKCQCAV